jgi:hypothetical protein
MGDKVVRTFLTKCRDGSTEESSGYDCYDGNDGTRLNHLLQIRRLKRVDKSQ